MSQFITGRLVQRLEAALDLPRDPLPFAGAVAERLAADAAVAAARLDRVTADSGLIRDAIALRGQGAPTPLLSHFDVAATSAAPSLARAERLFSDLSSLDLPRGLEGDALAQGSAALELLLEAVPPKRDATRLLPFVAADVVFARALSWRRPMPLFVGLVAKRNPDPRESLDEPLGRAVSLTTQAAHAFEAIENASLRSPKRLAILSAFGAYAFLSTERLARAAETDPRNARRAAETLINQKVIRELSGRTYAKVFTLLS